VKNNHTCPPFPERERSIVGSTSTERQVSLIARASARRDVPVEIER
jgi:hypothetical protein